MAKAKEETGFKEVFRAEIDDRRTTIVSEMLYNHGVLVRVTSLYRQRDGSYAIAEALTFVPSPSK